jgi:hypothetical protein
MLPDCTSSLKVAVTSAVASTFVAPAAGDLDTTVGATVSDVVNVQTSLPIIGLPAVSCAPATFAVYVVDGARAAAGSSVTVRVNPS